MALTLPGWLRKALEFCGYEWPAANEDVLNQWASEFTSISTAATTGVTSVQGNIDHVTKNNEGKGTEAFKTFMTGDGANMSSLSDFADANTKISTCVGVAAKIVVTCKLAVIAQLTILAGAIAGAIFTLGLGSGAAFAAREVCKRLVNAAINLAVSQIMGV